MPRDRVKFDPNERVDLPDFRAIQGNSRSEARALLNGLVFSDASTPATQTGIITGFSVDEDGPPSSSVVVSQGVALGAEVLDDNSREYGVIFGNEAPTPSQELDFTALGAGTYGVYIRFASPAGSPGARVFWNDSTQSEDVNTIDTRFVATWQVQAALVSPGDEWIKIADVVWGGVTIVDANITKVRPMAFEGVEPTYAHLWGDGPNDRDPDRATYGLRSLRDVIHFVRRKIDEIQFAAAPSTPYLAPDIALDQLAVEHDATNGEHTILTVQGDAKIGRFGGGADDYSIQVKDSLNGEVILRAQNGTRLMEWDQPSLLLNFASTSDNVICRVNRILHSFQTLDTGGALILQANSAGVSVLKGVLEVTDKVSRNWAVRANCLPVDPDDVGDVQVTDSVAYIDVNGANATLRGQVNLPDGVEITALRYHVYITSSSFITSCALHRRSHATGSLTTIATATYSSGTGNVEVAVTGLSHTVDNDLYSYLLKVFMDESGTGSSNQGQATAVEINYDTNVVHS